MAKNSNIKKLDLLCNRWAEDKQLDLFLKTVVTPQYVQDNLKDTLRPYQEKALRNLQYSQNEQGADYRYNHLLFNMATGSGKTMVMASTILYMYKEFGYQNFIFFVHTDAIIQKTFENLLNPLSSKYLFTENLEIDARKIKIEQVNTFPSFPDKNTIYLKLSTIHKVHDELNSYKENSVTYEDLKELPLILLGDEAHHFNAETKAKAKKKGTQENDELTWENTINNILSLNVKNRLFEYTATIDLTNKAIYQKYKDKIVYLYDLKQFMEDGFSKKVMLLEADQNDADKMLDAVLLSQYRKLVARDYQIENFKPIILFKSNQIAVSKKKQDEFIQIIEGLSPEKVKSHLSNKALQVQSIPTSIWNKVIERYKSDDLLQIVSDIKEDFKNMNLLNVNKADLIEEYPVLLNTLEEIDNPIRAVFAVAKVNEGWDVLNLYDIVRISERASTTKNSTDSEAQLIGRGARYFPFIYNGEKSYTRRFDLSTSDLGILEQLHYHTINEPAYITTLHKSLQEADISTQTDGNAVLERATLKSDFKNSKIYRYGKLYVNETEEIKDEDRSWSTYSLEKEYVETYLSFSEQSLSDLSLDIQEHESNIESLKPHIDKRYIYKALQKNDFFAFNNLQIYFPNLQSIDEFIQSDDYLNGISINVELPSKASISDLSSQEKLQILSNVLEKIASSAKRNYKKFKGTKRFTSTLIKDVIHDYSAYITTDFSGKDGQTKIVAKSTIGKKWYVYDQAIVNSLEHELIDWLTIRIDKLKEKYDDIYLIRNDEYATGFKLTEFGGVRGFMPDFIMIMTKESNNEYYQVLLEPKGGHITDSDRWKEEMLEELSLGDYVILDEDDNARLIGIKFFTKDPQAFTKDFEQKLYDGNELMEQGLLSSSS